MAEVLVIDVGLSSI